MAVNTRLLASGIILLVITYIFYERNIFKVLKTDFISLLLLGLTYFPCLKAWDFWIQTILAY